MSILSCTFDIIVVDSYDVIQKIYTIYSYRSRAEK